MRKRLSLKAATSASRRAAHSPPMRCASRCRWAGLTANPAKSRRSALASLKEGALPAWRMALRSTAGEKPSVPNCKASSRGEKDPAAGRAAEAGAGQGDLPGGGGQPPPGEGSPDRGKPLAGLRAVRARWGGVRRRVRQGVSGGVAAQQPGGQILAQTDGALFAGVEGEVLVLGAVGEHQVKGDGRLLEELLAQAVPGGGGVVHNGGSQRAKGRPGQRRLSYPLPPRAATEMHPPADRAWLRRLPRTTSVSPETCGRCARSSTRRRWSIALRR